MGRQGVHWSGIFAEMPKLDKCFLPLPCMTSSQRR